MRSNPLATLSLVVFLIACGPIGPMPGGKLSGDVAAPPPDWSASDAVKNVQLETDPDGDPYSVNVWGAGMGPRFYVAAAEGAESEWAQNMIADPNVRLRVGDAVYELRATKIDGEDERNTVLAAFKQKYDFEPEPEQTENAWLFRLDPR